MIPFICKYCGKDTSEVDYDYLHGQDHLSCALQAEKAAKQEEQNPFDLYEDCIMCGKKTTVAKTTHIDFRDGYIEGAGQLCPNCYSRGTEHGAIAVDYNIILSTPNDQELGAKVRQLYWENKK
jgi:hypothetical protein